MHITLLKQKCSVTPYRGLLKHQHIFECLIHPWSGQVHLFLFYILCGVVTHLAGCRLK